jgi:hypothetical protein
LIKYIARFIGVRERPIVITTTELRVLSLERLEDAKILYAAKRYEGAVYICGYANELALKRRICLTLGWVEYPDDGKGSDKYKSFKTHELEILLHLSGFENEIKNKYFAEWSIVVSWKPEMRYSFRKQSDAEAKLMIQSTEKLLKIL